mgnify:CR=1 FL=1
MLNLHALRWGKPYDSLEKKEVVHFDTGEPIAQVSQVGGGIVQRDLRRAQAARDALRQFRIDDLIGRCKQAAELFAKRGLDAVIICFLFSFLNDEHEQRADDRVSAVRFGH